MGEMSHDPHGAPDENPAQLPAPIPVLELSAAHEELRSDPRGDRIRRRWRLARLRALRRLGVMRAAIADRRRRLGAFERSVLQRIGAGCLRSLDGVRGLRRPALRRADVAIAGLACLALAAPFLAPSLRPYNPFVEPVGVRAERDVVILPDDAPTLWTGAKATRAERGVTPPWVEARLGERSPLSVALALTTPARVIDILEAPMPSFARIASPLIDDMQIAANAAAETSNPWTAFEGIETASIDPTDAGRYAPQSAPPRFAKRPVRRPEIDPQERSFNEDAQVAAIEAGMISTASIPSNAIETATIVGDSAVSPKVSIVLTAVGLNEVASQAALYNLPPEVVIAVAPISKRASEWASAAQQSGRQVLVEIPMEPPSYPRLNPGPLTLLTSATPAENVDRLAAALAEMPHIDGVSTYLGGRFKTDRAALDPVMAELKIRGLFVFENGGGPTSAVPIAAEAAGVTAIASSVSLDNGGRRRDISDGLAKLEEEARRTGQAVGVAVALPETVAAIAKWIRSAENRGFKLIALRH